MNTLSIGLTFSLVIAATGLGYAQHLQQQAPTLQQVLTQEGMNVKLRLDSLYNDVVRIRGIAGWELQKVRVVDNNALFFLENDGGFIATLRPWAQKNGYLLSIDEHGVTLLSGLRRLPPLKEQQYMSVLDTSAYVSDSLTFIHHAATLDFAKDLTQQDYKRRDTTITFNNMPYQDLVDIGTAIDGLPISFSDAEFQVNVAGELAGSFHLSIYGV